MRILVAMSGGVDSSVAAACLLKEGHEVEGAYMKNWINEDNITGNCPWQQDIDDASAAAKFLGIDFHVVNMMKQIENRLLDSIQNKNGFKHCFLTIACTTLLLDFFF